MNGAFLLHSAMQFCKRSPGLWRAADTLQYFRDRLAPAEAVRTMPGGIKLALRPGRDPYERQMYFHGTYEPATLNLFAKLLKTGDVMIDIGANLGLMTMTAASLVGPTGKVIAFEPNPQTIPRLEHNLQLNECRNVEIKNCALGSAPGQLTIYDRPSVNMGGASLLAKNDGIAVGVVEVKRLDDAISGIVPSLIKIDVEGFESEVLAGAMEAIRRHHPAIIMEFDRGMTALGGDPFRAYEMIMATGIYDCYKLAHSKFSEATDLLQVKNPSELPEADNVVFLAKSNAIKSA